MSRREPKKRVSRVQVSAQANMVEIPSGRFYMGSEDFYPEERPEIGRASCRERVL